MSIIQDLISNKYIVAKDGKELGVFKTIPEAKKFWEDYKRKEGERGTKPTKRFKIEDVVEELVVLEKPNRLAIIKKSKKKTGRPKGSKNKSKKK